MPSTSGEVISRTGADAGGHMSMRDIFPCGAALVPWLPDVGVTP